MREALELEALGKAESPSRSATGARIPEARAPRAPPGGRRNLVLAGGIGEIHRARDENLDRAVAIKILPSGAQTDGQTWKRFGKEAKTMFQLNPSHIATVYGFGTEERVDFLVNEYVEGTTLAAKQLGGALPVFGGSWGQRATSRRPATGCQRTPCDDALENRSRVVAEARRCRCGQPTPPTRCSSEAGGPCLALRSGPITQRSGGKAFHLPGPS